MTDTDQAEQLRRQMAQVRVSLGEEAEQIAQNARTVTDWRYYVGSYPWASLAVAAALGFLVVPRRLEVISPDASTLARLARQDRLVVKPKAEAEPKKGMAGTLFTFLSSMVIRGALTAIGQQVAAYFTAHPEQNGRPQAETPAGARRYS
ncbi:MAG TPA: hypothetical protein VML55_02700 [Planctomycetaceae bacterium]|nr:hypothetical protein [Planctomycetaceae bacterium]